MSGAIRFDPVGAADTEPFVTLSRAMNAEDGHPLDAAGEAAARRVCRGEPLAPAWMIRRGAQTLGYVVLTLGYSIEYGGRDGFIDELYIVPSARGQGLGREILAFVQLAARLFDVRALHLEVEPDNEPALDLYRRSGFHVTGRTLLTKRMTHGE